MADKLLNSLKEKHGVFVSGESLAKKLGMTRAGVWKRINILREKDYIIEALPGRGYRLVKAPDIITAEELESLCRGIAIVRKIMVFDSLESTNDKALSLAHGGMPEGTVVIADAQTKGKGRLGRRWISPPGVNIYMTIILRPRLAPQDAAMLTLMAAVAIVSAIRRHTGLPARIKWPNDILVNGKKAGGILTEMSAHLDMINYIALGIGINVNLDLSILPPDVRRIATSLKQELGKHLPRLALLVEIIKELDLWYRTMIKAGKKPIMDEWRLLDSTIGKRVKVASADRTIEGEGSAEGIDDEGRLILRLPSGVLEKFSAGDVTILKE